MRVCVYIENYKVIYVYNIIIVTCYTFIYGQFQRRYFVNDIIIVLRLLF